MAGEGGREVLSKVPDRAYVPAGHHLSLGVMWQYGDERSVASTRTMSVPYGVCCSSA